VEQHAILAACRPRLGQLDCGGLEALRVHRLERRLVCASAVTKLQDDPAAWAPQPREQAAKPRVKPHGGRKRQRQMRSSVRVASANTGQHGARTKLTGGGVSRFLTHMYVCICMCMRMCSLWLCKGLGVRVFPRSESRQLTIASIVWDGRNE
jgi:hypothetical protein